MSIFAADSKLTIVLNTIGNLMVLNILALICMLPVVTAGASLTSLYTMTMRIVRKEEGSIICGFLGAFKDNLKKSTIIWLMGGGLLVFMAFDIWLLRSVTGNFGLVYRVLLFVLMLFVGMVLMNALALTARFENTVKNTLKNALVIVASHLPQSALMLLIFLLPVLLLFVSMRFVSVDILIGLSGPAWLASVYFCPLFHSFEK